MPRVHRDREAKSVFHSRAEAAIEARPGLLGSLSGGLDTLSRFYAVRVTLSPGSDRLSDALIGFNQVAKTLVVYVKERPVLTLRLDCLMSVN